MECRSRLVWLRVVETVPGEHDVEDAGVVLRFPAGFEPRDVISWPCAHTSAVELPLRTECTAPLDAF